MDVESPGMVGSRRSSGADPRGPPREAIALPSSVSDPTDSPCSRGFSGLPPPFGLEEGRACPEEEFVPDAPSVSAEERVTFSTGWFLPPHVPQPKEDREAAVAESERDLFDLLFGMFPMASI